MNPLIVFANYIFDTVPQDLFRIEGGNVHEVRVTTRHANAEAPDLSNPEVMSQFALSYEQRPADVDNYYAESYLKKLLLPLSRALGRHHDRASDRQPARAGAADGAVQSAHAAAVVRQGIHARRRAVLPNHAAHPVSRQPVDDGELSRHRAGLQLLLSEAGRGEIVQTAATAQRQINLKTAAMIVGAAKEQFSDTMLLFQETVDTFGL